MLGLADEHIGGYRGRTPHLMCILLGHCTHGATDTSFDLHLTKASPTHLSVQLDHTVSQTLWRPEIFKVARNCGTAINRLTVVVCIDANPTVQSLGLEIFSLFRLQLTCAGEGTRRPFRSVPDENHWE